MKLVCLILEQIEDLYHDGFKKNASNKTCGFSCVQVRKIQHGIIEVQKQTRVDSDH